MSEYIIPTIAVITIIISVVIMVLLASVGEGFQWDKAIICIYCGIYLMEWDQNRHLRPKRA